LEIIMARALCDVEAEQRSAAMSSTISDLQTILRQQPKAKGSTNNWVDGLFQKVRRWNECECGENRSATHGPQKRDVGISIGSTTLKQVEDFVYLGGTISEDASTDRDTKRRTGLACGVMQNLNAIWKAKGHQQKNKSQSVRITGL